MKLSVRVGLRYMSRIAAKPTPPLNISVADDNLPIAQITEISLIMGLFIGRRA